MFDDDYDYDHTSVVDSPLSNMDSCSCLQDMIHLFESASTEKDTGNSTGFLPGPLQIEPCGHGAALGAIFCVVR